MPEISIIIPVYNAEDYLSETLSSVQKQTFTDFEVICVNDGSTDSSNKILRQFAADDKRFKVYNQQNSGGSISRNNGIRKAAGRYIAFLDNDDLYHPQYLEILHTNIQKYKADVSCCSYQSFSDDENFYFSQKYPNVPRPEIITSAPFVCKFKEKKKIPMLMWTKLYRRELVDKIRFSEKLPAINDVLFNLEILLNSSLLVSSSEKLIAYRLRKTSQTMRRLTVCRLDEYKNLPVEINILAQKYPQHAILLQKIATKYIYGMYIKEFLEKYHPEQKPELTAKISSDLNSLLNNNIFQLKLLNPLKRLKTKIFLKKYS